jgi:dihydroxyacetone kinase
MVAKRGRAKNLGERSIGYVDAGSMSMYYLLRAFADSLK